MFEPRGLAIANSFIAWHRTEAVYDVTLSPFQDQGDDPLFSDVTLEVYIGDVSNNDGIPRFVRPGPAEEVGVSEVGVTSQLLRRHRGLRLWWCSSGEMGLELMSESSSTWD